MTPVHPRTQIVLVNIVWHVLSAKAEQRQTARLEHSMEISQQPLMFLAWNMDDSIIGRNSIEHVRRKIQLGHIFTKKRGLGHVLFCQLNLRFRKVHAGYLEMLAQYLTNRNAGATPCIQYPGVGRQFLDEISEKAHIF